MEQRLPLLGPQVRVLVAQHELDRVEEVGLAGPVPEVSNRKLIPTQLIFSNL